MKHEAISFQKKLEETSIKGGFMYSIKKLI